jgi:2-C-methyl-D-erythritol 4-phosphate cytidylyltransferase
MKNELSVIVAAAGESKRFKHPIPKPFIILKNKPLLWYSLFTFQKSRFVKDIYVIVSSDQLKFALEIKKKYLKNITKLKDFIIGGKERSDSVFNALESISKNGTAGFVAIHDAARPFIKEGMLETLFHTAVTYGASAPAIPVVDTIKIRDDKNFILSHPKREKVAAIQTPQIFEFKNLFNAYKKFLKKNRSFTDDTEIYALLKKKIKIVQGDTDLLKITFPHDLNIAKNIIKKYKKSWI